MGDHFVLFVDRLITESTLDAAIESRKELQNVQGSAASTDESTDEISFEKGNVGDGPSSPGKIVECRICQDEDEDSSMEAPCSCCGSLKYAHRKCIQRWCDEKGDTTCEICRQQFKPGYTAPPQLFHYGGIPLNFRGNWEISGRDLNNPRIIAMVATDRGLVGTNYDDYSVMSTRSMIYCRSIAVIFMVLLVLRHILPIIITGSEQDLSVLIQAILFRTAGLVLPVYVMARAVIAFQRRRWQQQQQRQQVCQDHIHII
ncbi:hypothetical protein QJS04_geneDACA002980 [Acorus gramineus]|uniref:RING-CH-type domain-containing protein n=1 Tax=Acorus gramineus TaxID=55184 RepID=A0AAV9BWG7_ACOGR|nr:hypothetical protein QJS04_geneDACA002980 [Acorus gramineus]